MVSAQDISTPLLKQVLEHWDTLRGDRKMPTRSEFEPMDVPNILPSILLIQVQKEPLDFLYKVVGNEINHHSSESFSGRWMSAIPERRSPSAPWMNCQKVAESGEPSTSTVPYVGPHQDFLETSQVTLPLAGQDGETVSHLLIAIDYVPKT